MTGASPKITITATSHNTPQDSKTRKDAALLPPFCFDSTDRLRYFCFMVLDGMALILHNYELRLSKKITFWISQCRKGNVVAIITILYPSEELGPISQSLGTRPQGLCALCRLHF
jgi:hypothetical protein